MKLFINLFALIGLVVANNPPETGPASAPIYGIAPSVRPYSFNYAVRDGPSYNDYGHQETSDGKVVRGSYWVLLPDGRRQKVAYTVDDYSGFVADVTYEGGNNFYSNPVPPVAAPSAKVPVVYPQPPVRKPVLSLPPPTYLNRVNP